MTKTNCAIIIFMHIICFVSDLCWPVTEYVYCVCVYNAMHIALCTCTVFVVVTFCFGYQIAIISLNIIQNFNLTLCVMCYVTSTPCRIHYTKIALLLLYHLSHCMYC